MGFPEEQFGTWRDDAVSVLHVDDDPDFCDVTAMYLEQLEADITVITETTPEDGLATVSRETIDCVVTDYEMPGMDGVEFLRAVREDYPNLPVFLLTGKGSEEVASEAIEAGVTSYIQKGGTETYEQLVNRIRTAVDHHRTEQRAQVTRERLLELYEQTDGFFVLDSEWTVTYWNQQMERRTGRSADDVLGQPYLDAFPRAEGTELYDRYQRAMESREPVEFETFYEPHGYWVTVRVYPVDEGLFVHSEDITEEKEQEQELERRNHILESFANTVSHDLRNPLNVAEGRLQLAKETGDFEHLEEVAQAHNRMRNLINELLDVARGEESALTEVSLAESAWSGWETVTSGETELVVDEDATFRAYESQLRRLFENLFWNALDHGEATTVRVGVIDEEGIYVADDGVGIPVTDRESVFESGFSTVTENPGYGLSIVKRICGSHGWEIRVTEGRDAGARFEITNVDFIE